MCKFNEQNHLFSKTSTCLVTFCSTQLCLSSHDEKTSLYGNLWHITSCKRDVFCFHRIFLYLCSLYIYCLLHSLFERRVLQQDSPRNNASHSRIYSWAGVLYSRSSSTLYVLMWTFWLFESLTQVTTSFYTESSQKKREQAGQYLSETAFLIIPCTKIDDF